MKLRGKVVWITGASSGIGEALALAYARAGASVALSARRPGELERVAATLPRKTRSLSVPLDVADLEAIPDRLAAIEASLGPVDVLVNNAGISQRSLVTETSLETYRRIMEIDFFATVALTQAVLPGMIARRGGAIVVTSSVAGKLGTPLRSGYCAAKHALHGFYDSLRAEVARDGLTVTLAVVGYVRTDVSLNALRGDGSAHAVMDPAQAAGLAPRVVARRIVRAAARGKREVVVARGQSKFALTLARFAPGLLARVVTLRRAP